MKRTLPIALAFMLATPALAGIGRSILKGSTDQTTYIRIVDDETGVPETGVTHSTTGIDLEYVRLGAAPVDLTESTLGSASAAHSDGGIIHVGGGVYRVDLPDAAFATGVDQVSVQGTITGMVVLGVTHPLVDLSLSGQSAADLKDFADAGYDPTSHTITGITGTINDFDELVADPEDFGELMDTQGYTSARAVLLDNADVLISSRLAPTDAGRTLDVSTTGEAGIDLANIKQAAIATTLSNITIPNVTLVDTTTTNTDMVAAAPTASTIADAVVAQADMADGLTTIGRLEKSSKTIVEGVVGSGSTKTSIVVASITPAPGDADQFKALILKFPGDTTTAALRGQGTDITANTTGSTPTITVTELTAAPAAGDVFVIQ